MRKLVFFAVCCLCLHAVAWAQSGMEPFRIGLILDLAGPYAETSGQGSIIATKMAVDDFGGSVLGRRIEIVTADHQNSLERAASVARDWFDNFGVEAVMDVSGVSPAMAVHQIAKSRKKIAIFNSTGTWRLTSRFCAPYSVQYAYNADLLLRAGLQAAHNVRIADLVCHRACQRGFENARAPACHERARWIVRLAGSAD